MNPQFYHHSIGKKIPLYLIKGDFFPIEWIYNTYDLSMYFLTSNFYSWKLYSFHKNSQKKYLPFRNNTYGTYIYVHSINNPINIVPQWICSHLYSIYKLQHLMFESHWRYYSIDKRLTLKRLDCINIHLLFLFYSIIKMQTFLFNIVISISWVRIPTVSQHSILASNGLTRVAYIRKTPKNFNYNSVILRYNKHYVL